MAKIKNNSSETRVLVLGGSQVEIAPGAEVDVDDEAFARAADSVVVRGWLESGAIETDAAPSEAAKPKKAAKLKLAD